MKPPYILRPARAFGHLLLAAFYAEDLPGVWREFVLKKLKQQFELRTSYLKNEEEAHIQNVIDLCERDETDRNIWREVIGNTTFLSETQDVFAEALLDDTVDGPEQGRTKSREEMLSSLVAAFLLQAAHSAALGWVLLQVREKQYQKARQRLSQRSMPPPDPQRIMKKMGEAHNALNKALVPTFGAFLNAIVQAMAHQRCLKESLPSFEEGVCAVEFLLELQSEILLTAKKHRAEQRAKRGQKD